MQNKKLIEKIHKEILGIPMYGFEDKTLWKEFQEKHFSRSGEINNETYSSELNKTLSYIAMSQTLNEIRKRLNDLLKKLPPD